MNGLSRITRKAALIGLLSVIAVSSWSWESATTVDDDFNVGTPGWGVTAFAVIQDAVNNTTDTGTISINAGTYTAGFNLQDRTGLSIIGADRNTVIIRPSSNAIPPCYYWQTEDYTTQRRTVIRVVGSNNTTLQNFTVDGINAMAGGGTLFLVLISESDNYLVENLTLKNNHIPDSLAGGYSEFGIRCSTRGGYGKPVVSPYGYTCGNRASGVVRNVGAYDVGRVYFYTGGWTSTLIENCEAINDPALDEFGYGIEVGNLSEATVRNCLFDGFGTPALSDNSSVAAVYVENNFTYNYNCPKTVTVENCIMRNCQIGVWCGSGYNGTSVGGGNVDLTLNLLNNTIEDNLYGMIVTDQNAIYGSSVSLNASGNTFTNNINAGIQIFSDYGGSSDGDITTTFTHNTISGSDVAVQTSEGASGPGSSFDLNFEDNNLFDNGVDFDHNLPGVPLNTEGCWFGDETGPGPGDITGSGSGDVAGGFSTLPVTTDEDGDGLQYWEEDVNLNGVVDPGETDPNDFDTDNDGIGDGIDPFPLVPAVYTDADNDGQAAELGDTNDSNPDRDGDGYLDGYEVAQGTDPDNPNSKPTLGDVNGNNKVDNVNAVIIFAAFLGNTEYGLWNYNKMDVNGDGILDNVDAVILLNFFLKNVTVLPVL